MDIAKLILEYLKVILAPQIIAGIISAIFIFLFKDEIKALIRRTAKIRFPGGSELSTQEEKIKEESTKQNIPPASIAPEAETSSVSTTDQQKAQEIINAEQANARLWEYRYLNYFLVLTTQRVLDWLVSLSVHPTLSIYDNLWMPLIPVANERKAIIDALQTHRLILIQNDLIEVTDKGREYQRWRGTLPKIG